MGRVCSVGILGGEGMCARRSCVSLPQSAMVARIMEKADYLGDDGTMISKIRLWDKVPYARRRFR